MSHACMSIIVAYLAYSNLSFWVNLRGGGTHMLRHTGTCCIFGSVFWKKSLSMGPIFHSKIPKHGSDFQNFPGFAYWTLENLENLECFCGKIGTFFSEKSLNMGTYFWKNYPWTWVWVMSCWRHIPDQSKFQNPPGLICSRVIV